MIKSYIILYLMHSVSIFSILVSKPGTFKSWLQAVAFLAQTLTG